MLSELALPPMTTLAVQQSDNGAAAAFDFNLNNVASFSADNLGGISKVMSDFKQCTVCGDVKTSVWRVSRLPGYEGQTLCNACMLPGSRAAYDTYIVVHAM
jgi:hypothetical protein